MQPRARQHVSEEGRIWGLRYDVIWMSVLPPNVNKPHVSEREDSSVERRAEPCGVPASPDADSPHICDGPAPWAVCGRSAPLQRSTDLAGTVVGPRGARWPRRPRPGAPQERALSPHRPGAWCPVSANPGLSFLKIIFHDLKNRGYSGWHRDHSLSSGHCAETGP